MPTSLTPSNQSAAFFPLHPTPQPDFLVEHELPHHPNPAVMAWQVAIELVRDLIELPKSRPRYRREIVVRVVESDIVCEEVQDAVV